MHSWWVFEILPIFPSHTSRYPTRIFTIMFNVYNEFQTFLQNSFNMK